MTHEIRIERTIPAPREEVFNFNTKAELLEKWCAPNGMKLKVPIFEAKENGKYRYEHSHEEDVFVCNGHFEEFVPNEKFTQVERVASAKRGPLFDKLRTEVVFSDEKDGTKVSAHISGFETEKDANDCVEGWNQCLDKLTDLLKHQRFHPGQDLRSQQVSER